MPRTYRRRRVASTPPRKPGSQATVQKKRGPRPFAFVPHLRRLSGRLVLHRYAARGRMPKPIVLEVEHITTYRYTQPVEFSTHRVAFHPRAAHDIRVLCATLVEPLVPAHELRFTARFAIEHH
jgi:Bacterial transglutaminase-like N-terminal region